MKTKVRIELTVVELKLLKGALLCAEVAREKEGSNSKEIAKLHGLIDTQTFNQY